MNVPVVFAGFAAAFLATAFDEVHEFFSQSFRRQAAGLLCIPAPPFIVVVVVFGGGVAAAFVMNLRPVAVETIPAPLLRLRAFAIAFRKFFQLVSQGLLLLLLLRLVVGSTLL